MKQIYRGPMPGLFLLAAAFIAGGMAPMQAAYAQEGPRIGVLNVSAALFNSDAAQVVQEELEQELQPDTERADELREQLVGLRDEYEQNEAVMTDEEKRRANSDAQDLQVQLQLIAERIQQAVQARNQSFLQEMQEEVAAAVNDVVADGGFDIVLGSEAVIHADAVFDITARVTAKLNENSGNE